jgi:hypothetical protein
MTESEMKAQFIKFGLLANKVSFFRTGVPKDVVRELQGFKRIFSEMVGDKRLGEIARNEIVLADILIAYATALNSGKRQFAAETMENAKGKWTETDAMIYALLEKEGS